MIKPSAGKAKQLKFFLKLTMSKQIGYGSQRFMFDLQFILLYIVSGKASKIKNKEFYFEFSDWGLHPPTPLPIGKINKK